MKRPHRGIILVVSAPSGAGKTTVINALLRKVKSLKRSISTTTRLKRGHEQDGRDYYFVSEPGFKAMIKRKAFVEWAKVHGAFYGTSRAFLDGQMKRGYDVVLNIDVQGGRSIQRHYSEDAVLVFLLPPSWQELKRRLAKRGDIPPAAMKARLKTAEQEVASIGTYQYVVENDRIGAAAKRIAAILEVEKLKVKKRGLTSWH